MNDERKSKAELILELKTLRRQVKRYQAIAHRAERTEEALRESEAKYRLLVENSIDAVLLTSPDGGIQDANKAACRMFGRTVRELRQLGRRAVVDLSDPRLAQAIEGRKRLGKFKGELTLLRKDGSKFPGEISSVVFKDKDGNLRTSMSIRDITERKRAEAVPIESERKLKTLFEILPVGTSILDAERNIVYVNSALERILDVSTKGLLKGDYRTRTYLRPDGTLMPAEEFASVRAIKEQRAVHNVETGVVKEDGEVVWTSVSAVPVAFPDWKVVVVTSDITERKRAEEALQKREQLFQALIEDSSDVITIIDAHGTVQYQSPNYKTIWGRDPSGEIGRDLYKDVHPDEVALVSDRFNYLLRSPEGRIHIEVRARHEDGSWLTLDIVAHNLLDNPAVRGIVVHFHDITERKRAEENLRRSEDRYRDLVEHSQDLICTHDLEGRLLTVNSTAVKMLGYSLDEIAKMNMRDFLAPEVRQLFDRYLRRISRDHFAKGQLIVQTKSGERRIWEYDNTLRTEGVAKPFVRGWARDITERKRAEEANKRAEKALRASEERYRRLFEGDLAGDYVSTPAGKLIACNPAFARIFRFKSIDDALATSTYKLYPNPEARQLFLQSLRQHRRLELQEAWLKRRDGTDLHVIENTFGVFDDKGELIEIHGYLFDDTERKLAEEALRESEERFRRLYQQAPLGYQSLDAEGCFIDVNQAWLDLLGYSRDQVIGHWFGDFLAPQEVDAFKQRFPCFKATGEVHIDLEMVQRAGSTIIVHIDGKTGHDEHGQFKQTHCILHDITERKRAEEALRISENKFSKAFRASPDVLVISRRADGLIIETNDSWERLFGYSPEEVIGRSSLEMGLFANPADRQNVVAQLQEQSFVRDFEVEIKCKSGEVRRVALSAEPIEIDSEPCMLTIIHDITERKRAEEALIESERKLKTLFEILPVGASILDAERKIVYVNPAMGRILDISSEGLFGGDYESRTYLRPDGTLMPAEEFASVRAIKKQRAVYNVETGVVKQDGEVIWTSVSAVPVAFPDWKVVVVTSDITERKVAEEALRESEERLRRLYQQAPLGYQSLNAEGCFIDVNRAWLDLLGYSRDEVIGRWFGDFLAPQEVDVFKQRFPRFKATGEVHVDLEMIQRAASTIIVHIDGKIGHDEHGQFKQTHCILYDITERKRAEDALRESEERHRSLVEAVPDVIYTISAEDGSLTSLNPAFETVTGWSRAEWIGKPFASLVHPDDLPLAEQTFQRALRGETQPSYELRVLSKSGECLVGEFTSTPHVKDGKVVGEFGIARDITERKKVEQVLQQERILLRTLIDNLPDAIYVKDMASRKTVANLADVHNTGRQSEAEVLGKDDFELFPKDLAERFFADDQSVIQTGRPILEREEYVLDAEGQKRWLLTSKLPLRDKEGQVVGLVGIGRDITERKRAEEALRQSEEKYRMLFDEAPVGIAISTLEGKIVDVNKAQAEMIGHTVEELTGRSVNEYYLYPDRRIEMIELLKSNGKVRDFEMTLRKSDGSIITELLNLDKVQIGIIHYVLATGRDITERKRAEEALRESEEKYRNVVERANDGIAIVQDTLVKYVNATLAEVAGCTIEELIGAPFADYIYPDDLGKVADRYKRRIAGEDVAPVYEIAVRHKDGSKVYVEVNAGMIMYQGKPAELVIVRDLTERKRAELASKRAEEALRYERNLLRTLIDNLPDAVYVKDTECRKTVANAADVRYMGQQSEAEVLGKTDFDFYPADAAAVYHADDQSVVQTGQPVLNKAEFLVDKEGKEHWFSTSKLPLHDEQGRIIGLVGVGRDITERKRAEEALRLEKENFRRSLDESPLGVRIVTADGDTLYANRAILDFYGYDGLEELRKTPLRARYTPESYTEFQKRRQQRERGDFSTSEYGISIIRKNGEVLHLEVHRKQVLWDNAKQFLVMYQDITERKKAEEEVALLGHTIRSIGECVSVTDTENKILFVNEAFLRTYGYTADELIGKPIAVIRSPRSESAAEKVLSTTLKGGWQGELVNRKKDGTEFPIALSTFVIRNEKGQPIALVGIAADITERKLAEQASKRVEERLKSSREQLRALAAHLHRVREEERKHLAQEFHDQLGQTLTALKMDLTMLQRQVADKEKELSRTAVSVDIQAMQQIADHAIGSIREIMAELRPELLDQLGIMPALEFEAESFQRKSGISCVFTSLVDEIQLDQEKSIALFRIFQEALTNVVRHAKATSVRANIRMEGTNLLLEIKDNGVGILPGAEDAKDSFGIIGMRERALVFGGAFEIRGAKGEGTTIVLRLPLEETLADRGDA